MAETFSELIIRIASSFDKSGFDAAHSALDGMRGSAEGIARSLGELGAGLTKSLTMPIADIAKGMLGAAMEFETAFVGVKKTVDGTEADFERLRDTIINMSNSTTFSAAEIATVAQAAGQLGVKVKDIESFSAAMLKIGTATNLGVEEAATELARFATITGLPISQVENLGSAVVALGNNFATSESEIVALGSRLASAGSTVGLTSAEIMGLAAALSSVGLEAEAGGTALSRVMLEINTSVASSSENLKDYAGVAQMSADSFAALWKKDATEGLQAFISGLAAVSARGGDVAAVLNSIGMQDVRVRDALMRSANASGMLGEALGLASEEFKKNTALETEFQAAQKTTAAQLEMLRNTVTNVGIELGSELLPRVNGVAGALKNLVGGFTSMGSGAKSAILTFAGVAAAAGPVTSAVGGIIGKISGLPDTFLKVSDGLSNMLRGLGATNAAARLDNAALGSWGKLDGFIKGIMSPGGLLGIGAAVAIAAGAFALIRYAAESSKREFEDYQNTLKGVFESLDQEKVGALSAVMQTVSGKWEILYDITSTIIQDAEELHQQFEDALESGGRLTSKETKTLKKEINADVTADVEGARESARLKVHEISEAINAALGSVQLDTSSVTGGIQAAFDALKSSIAGIEGLSEEDKTKLASMASDINTPLSSIKSAMDDMNMTDTQKTQLANDIEAFRSSVTNAVNTLSTDMGVISPKLQTAFTGLSTAILNIDGLSVEEKNKLLAMAGDLSTPIADIKTAIDGLALTDDQKTKLGKDIDEFRSTAVTALNNMSVDFESAAPKIQTAFQQMGGAIMGVAGLSDDEKQKLITMAADLSVPFSEIENALNGLEISEDAKGKLAKSIADFRTKTDTALENAGAASDDVKTKLSASVTDSETLILLLTTRQTDLNALLDNIHKAGENAGQEEIDRANALIDEIAELRAQIRELQSPDLSEGRSAYDITRAGLGTEELAMKALGYIDAEMEVRYKMNDEKSAAAVNELNEQIAGLLKAGYSSDSDAVQKLVAERDAEIALHLSNEETIKEDVTRQINEIFAGFGKTIGADEALEDFKFDFDTFSLLQKATTEGADGGVSAETLKSLFTPEVVAKFFSMDGITPEQVANEIDTGEFNSTAMMDALKEKLTGSQGWFGSKEGSLDASTAALENNPLIAMYQAMIDQIEPDKLDFTKASGALAGLMRLDTVGETWGEGEGGYELGQDLIDNVVKSIENAETTAASDAYQAKIAEVINQPPAPEAEPAKVDVPIEVNFVSAEETGGGAESGGVPSSLQEVVDEKVPNEQPTKTIDQPIDVSVSTAEGGTAPEKAGENIATQVVSGMTGKSSLVTGASKQLGASASNIPTDLSKAESQGGAVAEGVASGIRQKASSAESAANYLADLVLRTFGVRLKIESPSKVFMQMGGFLTQGLANGVRAGAREAVQAVEDLAADMEGAIRGIETPSYAASVGGGAADAQNGADARQGGFGGVTQVLNIYAPQRLDPRAIAKESMKAAQYMTLQRA
ncbi:MAG: phage tail tape measure protein [Oscillospiraceae bacterium]|jgi:TP901 family phage tail tape measure protein|nr:phage tail tape measure protein [Oscillospiraceae bacterium]